MERIGVIGFGFSGLMATANIVRMAQRPVTVCIIDDEQGFGPAYNTRNPDHLLNVRAAGMSAFADDPDGFVHWLQGDAARIAKAELGIENSFSAQDFVPRALYGAYLESIWRDTQAMAVTKNLHIKLLPCRGVAVQAGAPYTLLTARGDAIAVDAIVLAVGHEPKPVFPEITSPAIIQNPWAKDALAGAAQWASPVLLIGSGLTAVDAVLSLRRAGYTGAIIAASRHGLLPQVHGAVPSGMADAGAGEIPAVRTLAQMVRLLRGMLQTTGDWRVAVDALRPATQTLWQRLSTPEQKRFLTRLATLWGVHRHRMAPAIGAQIEAEIAHGTLRVVGKGIAVREEGGRLSAEVSGEVVNPSRILNCMGLELNLARSKNPLLRQLLAEGWVEPHATGLGVAADPYCRAWGGAHPNLFVLGSLLTGQLLESTAVPELRVQAALIARQLVTPSAPDTQSVGA
jgi:uncharacterized NAD(P)/FAD-binding protein YdhS